MWPLNSIFIKKSVLVSNIIIKIPETFRIWIQTLILIETGIFSHSKFSVHRPIFVCVIRFYVVWQAVWHRLCQFKLNPGPILIIPASTNMCLIKESCLSKWQILTYGVGSKNPIRCTSTLHTDLPLCLANGGFSLATVAEEKPKRRAAIPIMGNNSLLSET